MVWVEITFESVLGHMPTDLKAIYEQWLIDFPDRDDRLEMLTDNTIREFRDAIKSNKANYYDPRETYLPQSAVRHLEAIIFYQLAMEMGLKVTTHATSSRVSADVFLRQIPFGRWNTTTEDAVLPSPRFVVPVVNPFGNRVLPALLIFLLAAQLSFSAQPAGESASATILNHTLPGVH